MENNISLVWENISVELKDGKTSFWKSKKTEKIIINDVSGSTCTKNLVAIMGASGSGKTTLITTLSGRQKGKTGIIKINDTIVPDRILKTVSGFMHQEDIFTESLSTYEYMKFMTALKVDKKTKERKIIMEKLLIDLGLEKSKHTIIKFLSGGERRRLSLASELISDPLILFCDEPTTGLDSFSAMTVVQKLEETAKNNKIVLATIHQPSSQIFQLFHNIILLANGKLIFQGSKEEAKYFFENANLHCPPSYNPADFYIKCLTVRPEAKEQSLKQILLLSNSYKKLAKENSEKLLKEKLSNGLILPQSHFKKSFWYEFKWLSWRIFLDTKRNLNRYYASSFLLLITSLILGTCYSSTIVNNSSSVQNIQGALILIISELIFTHMYAVVYIFPTEVTIFVREKCVYGALPYFISRVLAVVPHCFINAALFLSVYFILLDFLKGIFNYFGMLFVLFTANIAGSSFGLCLSALFPSIEFIDLFIAPLELIVMMLSGIWIKINTLPVVFGLIKYISPFFYTFQSMSTIHWKNIEHLGNCTTESPLPCYESGKDVLEYYALYESYNVVAYNMVYLLLLSVFYCSIGYIGIVRKRMLYG